MPARDEEDEFDFADDKGVGDLRRRAKAGGVAFQSDLGAVGSVAQVTNSENIFAPEESNILDEERRLIDKVFSIVDKDGSGSIDTQELQEMFTLFGVATDFLSSAIERVMANADKDHDAQISPTEFYKLLSMKFSKGDSRKDMEDVFDKMGAMHVIAGASQANTERGKQEQQAKLARGELETRKQIGIDELHKVALMLGETNMTKHEIKDMVRCMKRLAQPIVNPEKDEEDRKKKTKPAKLRSSGVFEEGDTEKEENILSLEEFVALMEMDL